MPRLAGVSDRDAGLGAKIAYFFTKRRFKQMTGLETATMLEPLRMYVGGYDGGRARQAGRHDGGHPHCADAEHQHRLAGLRRPRP